MVSEYVYSPHVDFFIDRVDRDSGYEMASFHIHHKYEIYYEIEAAAAILLRMPPISSTRDAWC